MMCYTPPVSLATALIEWLLAAVILVSFTKSVLRKYGAAILFLLGFYQFSEFMLCMTGQAELWGTVAFLSYTFLPAIGLHAVLSYLKKKVHPALLYAFPVVFSLFALLHKPFILKGTCETIFVTILTYFSAYRLPGIIYSAYYLGFILATFLLFVSAYRHEHGSRKKACMALLVAVLLMAVPTFILIVIFPALRVRSASVLCHFALLSAAAFFIAVHFDSK